MKLTKAILTTGMILFLVFSLMWVSPDTVYAEPRTIMVTTSADSGSGSLREALETATANTTIRFDPAIFPLDDPQVILLEDNLPPIWQGNIIIDASDAGVIIDCTLINQLKSTEFDNVIFSINDEVIFEDSFSTGIQYWRHEAPDASGIWFDWKDSAVLEITNMPNGHGLAVYYDEYPDLDWYDLWQFDASPWYQIKQGDTLSLTYDYRGDEHHANFTTMSIEQGNIAVFGIRDNDWEFQQTDEWKTAELSITVPQNLSIVFPTFQPSNFNGNGLTIESDNNEFYGLVIRNTNIGILVMGEENLIGQDNAAFATDCAGSCNRIESSYNGGIHLEGNNNIVTGNWFGVDENGTPSELDVAIFVFTDYNQIGTENSGNVIFSINGGIAIDSGSRNIVQNNIIYGDDSTNYSSGIGIWNQSQENQIGPNNHIEFEQIGIQLFTESEETIVDGTEVFENTILNSESCGIRIDYAVNTKLYRNWLGLDPKGEIGPNQEGICLNGAENTQVGPENVIANGPSFGIGLENSPGTHVTQNKIFYNSWKGVQNWDSAGDEPEPPEIITVSTNTLTVIGRAEAGSMVEIFFDAGNQGADYAVSCEANKRGKFYCTIPKDLFQTDKYVTAIAYRPDGGTSEFSEPRYVEKPQLNSFTGIVSPTSLPSDPKLLTIGLLAGILFFLAINIMTEVLPNLIGDFCEQHCKFLTKKKGNKTLIKPWKFSLLWIGGIVLTAFLQAILEGYSLGSSQHWILFAFLLGILLILSIIELISEIFLRKKWKLLQGVSGAFDLLALLMILISVGLSRIFDLSPGILMGSAAFVVLLPELNNAKDYQSAVTAQFILFLFSMICWGISPLMTTSHPELEALLLMLFFVGEQAVFFNLMPFGDSPGKIIRDENKKLWRLFVIDTALIFIFMIFIPAFADVDAIRQNDYTTLWIISGILIILTGFFTATDKFHWFTKKKTKKETTTS